MKNYDPWRAVAVALFVVWLPAAEARAADGRGKTEAATPRVTGARTGFLAGAPERLTLFPSRPEMAERITEEMVIRMAYEAVAEAIERSGHYVSFTIEDPRTYYRRDFGAAPIAELVTVDSPRQLAITETEVGSADGAVVGRAFTPQWVSRSSAEDLEAARAVREHYAQVSMADMLRGPDIDDDHRRLVALTSYAVRVEYEGETHRYRAMCKWIPSGRGEVTFMVEDHVTNGVDQVLASGGLVAPIGVLLGRSLAPGSGSPAKEAP